MTHIKVTQDHIDVGRRKCTSECPIALAVASIVRPVVEPRVYTRSIMLRKTDPTERGIDFTLPQAAVDFIASFDAKMDVDPIEFDLDIPADFLKDQTR